MSGDPAPENVSPAALHVPDINEDMDTCAAALAYAEAGWYVLPIRAGSKHPGSRLGNNWQKKSTRDPRQIVAYWAGTNDGIALHCGRSGAIVVDLDTPDRAPSVLVDALSTAPFQQSRTTPPGRGHYVFAQPPGRTLGNSVGRLGSGWGEMRGLNGVIVVAPSVHEDADDGAAYIWRKTGTVTVLPATVAELVDDVTPALDAASETTVAAFLRDHCRSDRPTVLAGLLRTFTSKVNDGGSRHTTAVSTVVGALKEARAGYYPAGHAVAELERLFLETVTDPRRPGLTRTVAEARREWTGIVAWGVGQALAADLDEVRARTNTRMPPEVNPANLIARTPGTGPPAHVDPDTGEVVNRAPKADSSPDLAIPTATNLPDDFYAAREHLDHIRQAAHARARAADAVLGVVLARAAAAAPPTVTLPAIVGAQASLNMTVAIIGPPGGGKSTAKRLASELVPLDGNHIVDDLPLGSGEGLVDAYFDLVDEKGDNGKPHKVKRQTRTSGFFYLDEGQALGELGGRKGAILLPTLRSAWTGDTLGQTNASEDRKRRLPAGAYRMSVVVGFQPEHAVGLLDDAAGGTPQRFLWVSAVDPAIPDEAPPWPGPLPWSPPTERGCHGTPIAHELGVPTQVAAEVRTAAIARTRGETVIDTLDAHRDLSKLKLAALLALLDDRDELNNEDWQLAEVVMRTSDAVRSTVAHHAQVLDRQREDSSHARASRRELRIDHDKANVAAQRMAQAIARHVHRGRCDDGCRRRCCTQSTRSTDRKVATIDEALDAAEREGWIVRHGDTITPGETRPA